MGRRCPGRRCSRPPSFPAPAPGPPGQGQVRRGQVRLPRPAQGPGPGPGRVSGGRGGSAAATPARRRARRRRLPLTRRRRRTAPAPGRGSRRAAPPAPGPPRPRRAGLPGQWTATRCAAMRGCTPDRDPTGRRTGPGCRMRSSIRSGPGRRRSVSADVRQAGVAVGAVPPVAGDLRHKGIIAPVHVHGAHCWRGPAGVKR